MNDRRSFTHSAPSSSRPSPFSTTVSGNAVALDAAGGCAEAREGPEFPSRNGPTWMTYSIGDTEKPDHQLWMMSLANNADPLSAANWQQHSGAVFSHNDSMGVYGPDHHAYFKSPDGTEEWMVSHAKSTSQYTYTDRTSQAQKIGRSADGSPNPGTPLAMGATQNLPSGDPGSGNHWSDQADYTATFTGTQIDFYGALRTGRTVQYVSPELAPPAGTPCGSGWRASTTPSRRHRSWAWTGPGCTPTDLTPARCRPTRAIVAV